MKNKKIQYFASAAALILGAVLLTTCTVGLGDSVDTKSPKVSITYPPVQSIIKNTFTLRGTASDDNELVGVMITVTNTESDEVFDGYQATVDRATNTWSFAANRRNEDGSFEFEDGKYQIIATAVDGANRKTVASTTYEIDNTAPVLVLNRPGTVGPVGNVKPEVYGSELKLTGSANDDHALDLVSMRVFRADGTPIGAPLTYANVSGVGMEILLAKHYASPADADQQALTDRYAAIYDHSTGGTQNFYCLVDISDYAREYDPPANVASTDNTRGNVSQAFWLYDGIYSRVFDKSGFGLTMSDLTSVLSGRYASVATAGEVREYLEANQQNSTVWNETAVTFSLNPENSPYYEVVGYNALATNESITAQASNGTNLTVRVSAGRDQRPLLSDTIRVYLDPCNANGAPLSGEGDNILLLASIAELAGNTAAIEERNDRLSKTGNDYVVSVDVGTLLTGNYYIVKVEGEDQAGNEITDLNGTFGFQVIASGNPPVLVVNSPSDLSYISANSVNFDGTVEAEGGLSSLTATVTITRMSGGAAVRTAEPQSFTIVPSDSNPAWAFTLDTATGITPADGLCMATVTLKATDLKNTITEQKLRLYIDHQAPTAIITNVTPYYGYVAGVYTVNGTVEATLSLTDNDQLVLYSYTINGGTPSTPVAVTSPVVSLSIPSINTLLYTDDQDLPFTVTLRDRAGNEATIDLSTVIHIDQDTDRPTIELSNPGSLAADEAGARDNLIVGSSITGNVADDDGVFSLQLTIYDTDDNPVATKLFTAGEMNGASIRKSFSYTFPSGFGDGIYRLTLDAYDINSSPVASTTSEGWFSYDANPPRIDSWETVPVSVDVISATFTLSGTGSDDYALKDSDQVIVYQSFNGGTAVPLAHAVLTPNGTNTSCDWVAANLPWNFASPGNPAPVGEYTYTVTVYDWLNNFTTVETVTVQYDTANPVVTGVTFPAETGVNNYVTGSTDFRGTASDEGTGVAKVECSLDGTTWEEATGDKNWSINPSLLNLAAEGAKTLYVRATDAVRNESSPVFTRTFVYDNSTPSLTSADTAPTSGLTLTKGGFSLSGSAADGYQLRASNSVVITQQLGNGSKIQVPVTITSTGATTCDWDILGLPRIPLEAQIVTQVPFDGSHDGTYKYEITVYDAAGQKSDPETITVQLDSHAPTVTEISAPVAGGVVGTNTSFNGQAADPDGSGVREVRFSVDDWSTSTVAGGNTNWQASYSFASGVVEGTKTLRVVAEDTAGNVGSELTRSFVFDRANPTLAITRDILGVNELSRDGVFDLEGTAIDTNGIASIVVLQDGVAVLGGISISGSAPSYTWEATGLPRDPGTPSATLPNDGTYTYQIHAVDKAGKSSLVDTVTVTIDTTAPETNTIAKPEAGATGVMALSDATYLFRGSANDTGVGVAKVWYQIIKNSTAPVVPGEDSPADYGYTELLTGGGWSFTRDLVDYTLTPAEGEISEGTGYYLHVLAEDKAGNRNAAATSVAFDVDLDDPEVTETEVGVATMVNRREGFDLLGTATDSHGIDTVTITQSLDGGTAIEIDMNGPDLTLDGTGFEWTLNDLPRGNTAGTIGNPSTVNGIYEYQITTTDLVGKTHTIVRRIRFDSVGPTIEFTAPGEGGWQTSGTVTVKGLATDLTAVGGVYYSTAASAPAVPVAPDADADWTAAGWTKADGTVGSWEITRSGLGEGNHSVWVAAMDTIGNTTAAIQRTFGVDTAVPVHASVSTPTQNTDTGFDLTGTASDTNALHPTTPITITQSYNGNPAVTISGNISPDPASSGELWTLENLPRNPGSPLTQIDFDGTADGEYEFTITATDIAGKTSNVTRTVRIDTRNPVLTVAESVETSLSDWINTASLSLSGEITDTDPSSGIRKVEYTHINSELVSTTQTLSVNGINWTGNLPLSNGENQQLTITATDYAGNTDSETYTFDVDLSSPTLTKLTPTGQLLTNLESPIVSTFSVTDEGASGVASVLVTSIGSNSIAVDDQTSSLSGGIWTISVPPTTLDALTLGATEVVTVTATDGAGNSSISTFQISIDTEDPDVLTISSPGDGATINKVTEIRGTASDAVMLDTVDLYIEEGPGTGTFPATSTAHFTGGGAYNWSYPLFDTEVWAGAAYTGPVRVRVIATDEAGNTRTLDYTYNIDQESDRPRIRSNNPELIFNDGDSDYPSTIQTKNIIGTIEDDDGMVAAVEIKVVDHQGAGDWESVSMSGTSFTYTVDQSDGAKTLYFRITDAKGTPFKTFETGDTGDILPPKFEWGPVATPEFAYPARGFSIDVTSPTKMPQVYVHRTGESDFNEAVELVPNMPFGGTSGSFVLWVGGSDANGIESIEVTVPGAATETQVLTNAHRDDTTGITNFTVFRSAAFDVSGIMPAVGEESVTLTVDIKITDTTGLTAFDSKVILVDNVLPVIDHNYPANVTEQVFGNLTITGGVSDGGSGLPSSAVTYQIGYDYDSDDASPAWKTAATSGATWSILDFETVAKGGAGDRIETYTRKEVTAVDIASDTFTVTGHGYANGDKVWVGADELPAGLNFATEYYVRDAAENTFKLASSPVGAAIDITTTGDESLGVSVRAESAVGNIWYLPVIVRAYDKAGNKYVTPVGDYRIKVDPSGDKPSAYILYPEANTTNDANKPIVGGTVRMNGWAEDNVAVAAVYMQIDVDGDGDFTAADVDSEGIDWYNGADGNLASGSRNWSMTINESGEFNPEVITGDEIESGVVYKIEVLGSGVDWTGLGAEASPTVGDTFTADRNGSAADSSAQVKPVQRLIKYRVRAVDTGGIIGSWSEPNFFLIDEGVPVFGSLRFEQAGKQRSYEPDMWLSGDWDLTGTVADESNIYSITIGNTTGADDSQITGSLAGNSAWFASNSNINGLAGYDMTIPILTSGYSGTRTSNSFTITAEDGSDKHIPASREIRINYDNVVPDISAAYGGATPIQNSDGTYELSSTVEEAQSGFDRVMVVFHRPIGMTDGGRVYNPLYGTGAAENYILWGSLTESPEGLPLRAYTSATRENSTTSLTHAAASADPYARKGYYLRIGGIYHRITDVTGTTITWEGDADVTITDFELVYAIAVDNLNTETATIDDGDGIREAVERSVSDYTWRCAIDSTNLPDGQMNIRYVAFDKAGNFAQHTDIETRVENNPPLLAQVRLATNLDGSATITENEWNPPYSTLVAGVEQKAFAVDASPTSVNPFTAKDFMNVDIDIVGGNGALHYTLGLKNGATVTPVTGHVEQSLGTGGEDQDHAATTSIIAITLDQLQAMGDGARNFFFNIWDSTETYATNTSTVFTAELTVMLTVDVVDETAPVTVISPFFWNDADDNSLYGNSRDNGHIELGTEPKVSGQISIRGTAYDDQRLTALWMYVGDTAATGNFDFPRTAPAPATESKTIYGKTYYKMATYTPGSGWTPTPSVMNENGWVFSVDDEYLDQTGHLVSWQLDWDTAEIDGIAAVDRYVLIVAEDKRTNPNPNPSLETLVDNPGDVTTNNVPYYRMDVVPYVQEVVTGLSSGTQANSSIYNRTALGKYPVQENEDIEIKGFNFNGTATTITINGTPLDTPSVIDSNPTKHLGLNIGTSADSGELVVTVGTVESLNNVNDNTQEYNQLPNLTNNDKLTDNVSVDIWSIQDAAAPRDGGIIHPEMEIGPSGEVGFAFVNGNFYFNMAGPANAGETFSATGTNTWASQRAYEKEYAQYWESAFAFDGDGNTYGMSTNIDVYIANGNNYSAYTSFYFGRRAGRINPPNGGSEGWNTTTGNYQGGLYRRRLQSTTSSVNGGIPDTNPNRALSPALATATHGDRTNVYMAYYDAVRKEIRYRYGSVGRVWERRITNDATAGANTRLTSNDHGFVVGDLVSFTKSSNSYLPAEAQLATYEVLSVTEDTFTVAGNLTGWIDGNTYASAIGGQIMDATGGWSSTQGVEAGSGTTDQSVRPSMYTVVAGPGSSGKYVDVGVVPQGTQGLANDVAVIVWFDAAARALKYGYCTNPQQDDAVFSVDTIDAAGGWYPRIKVDSDGGIHIAYYGTSGADLKYAYATGYDESFTTVTVDSYQLVGTQVTLDVAKDATGNVVPYIGYYSPSAQTAKVAYPVIFNGRYPTKAGVENDKYTGNWEVSNLPTNTITPKDDTVCVGVHKDWSTGVLAAIASSVGTLSDAGEDNNIPSRTAGNGTTNPAIAFVAEYDAGLKMAQKK